jgi:hypothetical protein
MRVAVCALLVACATHDALRSEPLVRRAVCSDEPVEIYGYPHDAPSCGAHVINIGDGCYIATRTQPTAPVRQELADGVWAPQLFECSASAPDGHVACLEDAALGRRDDVWLPEPETAHGYWLWVPAEPDTVTSVVVGRCEHRLQAWEAAHLPPPARLDLYLTSWSADEPVPFVRATPPYDPITVGRLLGGTPLVRATACPEVTVRGDYPADFDHLLVGLVGQALDTARVPRDCRKVTLAVDFVR